VPLLRRARGKLAGAVANVGTIAQSR
jgi:hypothetical protein